MIDEKQLITELELEIGETYNCDIGYGLKRAIEIVEHRPLVGEWIPCSERLPEDRKEKLVYLSSGGITIARHNKHRLPHRSIPIGWGYIAQQGFIDFENETVIAWMPLPPAYKEEVTQ